MKDLAVEGAKRSHQALADLNKKSWMEMVDKGKLVKATPEERKAWQSEFKILWDQWIAQAEASGVKEANDIFTFWKSAADKAWQQ